MLPLYTSDFTQSLNKGWWHKDADMCVNFIRQTDVVRVVAVKVLYTIIHSLQLRQ